jgi:hypothetical protein
MNFLDTMDSIFTVFTHECPNMTQEKLQEGKNQVVGNTRMDFLNRKNEESRERLRES